MRATGILLVVITVLCAAAGQHFAYRSGLHRANAEWHGWMADGWRIYLRTLDPVAAFGNGRPTPTARNRPERAPPAELAPCRLYDWERDGI